MSRLPVHTLIIPSADRKARDIVLDTIIEAGLDPKKAATIPIMPQLVRQWVKGEITREMFVRCCSNLAAMNPDMAV